METYSTFYRHESYFICLFHQLYVHCILFIYWITSFIEREATCFSHILYIQIILIEVRWNKRSLLIFFHLGNIIGEFFELSQTDDDDDDDNDDEEDFYNYQALKNAWKIESLKFQLLWAVKQRFGLPLGFGLLGHWYWRVGRRLWRFTFWVAVSVLWHFPKVSE